jgi:hypothetical protein
MPNLYGTAYVEKQRSAGYKSTIYALAELVDNSVDAEANLIEILLFEKSVMLGQRRSQTIDKIVITDNGKGMPSDILNYCLMFSVGEGTSDKRIGKFGVGLPNSSISVGRKVEIYSRVKGTNGWNYVFLDLDDQPNRSEPGYDDAASQTPPASITSKVNKDVNSIIIWSKLDRVDASRSSTIIERGKLLLGRIYRYKLTDGLSITFSEYLENNLEPNSVTKILAFDPLFLTTQKNYITEILWNVANNQEKAGKHLQLGSLPEFNSSFHYKKFIENCIENETNLPLFQKVPDKFDWETPIELNGKIYKYKIRAAFAYKDITKPGIGKGGSDNLEIGKVMRMKMLGKENFKSANIFFMRAGREVDYGSYGLYNVSEEVARWWTIEILFDSDLDELMGISNTKQSVDFNFIEQSSIGEINRNEILTIGQMKEILWADMTQNLVSTISRMRDQLSKYAKQFKEEEASALSSIGLDGGGDGGNPIRVIEQPIVEIIGKASSTWNQERKNEFIKFLKDRFMHIAEDQIIKQVEVFSSGLTKTLVLYAPDQTNQLFTLSEVATVQIVIINTNHSFYINIIDPLKSTLKLKEFAISIEMLLSSMALTMQTMINDNSDRYKDIFEIYRANVSSKLNEFMMELKMSIDPDKFKDNTTDDLD